MITLAVVVAVSVLTIGFLMQKQGGTSAGLVTGTVDLTIQQDATIQLSDSQISFGAGSVDAVGSLAVLDSYDGSSSNWNGVTSQDSFGVQNDGNTNVDITVTMDKTPLVFYCGDNTDCLSEASEGNVEFRVGSDGGEVDGVNCGSSQNGWTNLTTNEKTLCAGLTPYSGGDSALMSMRLSIPSIAQGDKTSSITFVSTASS